MQQNETTVGDLYQAAYLVAAGCEFPGVTFERTGRVKSDLPDADVGWHCEAYKLDHGNGGKELVMGVRKFVAAVRKLKAAGQQEKAIKCAQRRN